MKIEELKEGDIFYDVTLSNIKKYRYWSIYPFENLKNRTIDSYHVIINKNTETPERIYYKDLINILNKKIFNYDDAKKYQIKMYEEYLNYLKSKQL